MLNNQLRIFSASMLVIFLASAGTATTAFTDDSVSVAETKVLKRGKLMWLRCVACHDLTADKSGNDEQRMAKVGPDMYKLIGRPAGTLEGFVYSDALRNSGLTWDKATLSRWIEKPSELVPGTFMAYIGMPSESDRQALIEYIESETSE